VDPDHPFPCRLCGQADDEYRHIYGSCQVVELARKTFAKLINIPISAASLGFKGSLHLCCSMWCESTWKVTLVYEPTSFLTLLYTFPDTQVTWSDLLWDARVCLNTWVFTLGRCLPFQ
jgi:hypothetical protein